MYVILGAGLSGLSCSFHLKHENCQIFEQHSYVGGHIYSEQHAGFTWDEGPHVSFTKSDYVRALFDEGIEVLKYPVFPVNYYQGTWIDHPAQTNLYVLPEPLKQACVSDFLAVRNSGENADFAPKNYQEWLEFAFGETFANTFPRAYTKKYWTTEPANLTTDWVGSRVYFPEVDDVVQGAQGPLTKATHYISSVYYPAKGGYFSFATKLAAGANVTHGKKLSYISFADKQIQFTDGTQITYEKLVNTIPLPILIKNSDAPDAIKQAADLLSCSSVLILNIAANHASQRANQWLYVYDESKHSTRINFTELLSPSNGPTGKTGIQVEVYFSKYKPFTETIEDITAKVIAELVEMQLLQAAEAVEYVETRWLDWANVIFDNQRQEALNTVLNWLSTQGLHREEDDLAATTDWEKKFADATAKSEASIFLAGRFAQWNYYWTDDCVLRGKYISSVWESAKQ
jgi:protoporphyrinogen oxidase